MEIFQAFESRLAELSPWLWLSTGYSYTAQLKPPVAFGPCPTGTRFFVEATEGRVEGKRLSGTVGSGGGDWLLAGTDGVGRLGISMASGDLPPSVEMIPVGGPLAGNGTEGTALLEIVHDLAPGARLLFAAPRTSWPALPSISSLARLGRTVSAVS